jgi:hypothetical protein
MLYRFPVSGKSYITYLAAGTAGKSDPRNPGSGLLGGGRAPNQCAQEVREIALKRVWLKVMSVRNGHTVLLKITDEGGRWVCRRVAIWFSVMAMIAIAVAAWRLAGVGKLNP